MGAQEIHPSVQGAGCLDTPIGKVKLQPEFFPKASASRGQRLDCPISSGSSQLLFLYGIISYNRGLEFGCQAWSIPGSPNPYIFYISLLLMLNFFFLIFEVKFT